MTLIVRVRGMVVKTQRKGPGRKKDRLIVVEIEEGRVVWTPRAGDNVLRIKMYQIPGIECILYRLLIKHDSRKVLAKQTKPA